MSERRADTIAVARVLMPSICVLYFRSFILMPITLLTSRFYSLEVSALISRSMGAGTGLGMDIRNGS